MREQGQQEEMMLLGQEVKWKETEEEEVEGKKLDEFHLGLVLEMMEGHLVAKMGLEKEEEEEEKEEVEEERRHYLVEVVQKMCLVGNLVAHR